MSLSFGSAKAGPFNNLDFEDSPLPTNAPPSLSEPTSLLFPSWTLRIGDSVQSEAYLNTVVLAGPAAALFTLPTPDAVLGTRTLYLQSWVNVPVSIAQVGSVPGESRSIRFWARNSAFNQERLPPGPFDLQMDGQSIPLVPLASSPNGTNLDVLYGGDISAWDGMTSELRLSLLTIADPRYTGWAVVDAISFSSLPVPEPSAALLLQLVVLMVLSRIRARPAKTGN